MHEPALPARQECDAIPWQSRGHQAPAQPWPLSPLRRTSVLSRSVAHDSFCYNQGMDALTALRTRRSVRAFVSRPVPREALEQIVDAGRLAATARNLQPWHFVIVTQRATLDRLAQLCDHGKFLAQAPACIAVFCDADAKYYLEDGSAATQNMLVAAHALGLGACWIAGDKKPYATEVAKLLHAPPTVRLISLVAVGYPAGSVSSPPKKPLADLLHWERFSA